jgi:hypothetical protein
VLKTYLQLPDDQLRPHLRRLLDDVGKGGTESNPGTT